MNSKRFAFCLLALLGLAPLAPGGDVVLTGTWTLSTVAGEQGVVRPVALLRFARVNKEWIGVVLDAPVKNQEVKAVTYKNGVLRMEVQARDKTYTFEGVVAPGGKTFRGSYGSEDALAAATLAPARAGKISKEMTIAFDLPPLKKLAGLHARAQELLKQLADAKDQGEKTLIIQEYQAALKGVKKEAPGLYREAVTRHPDSPVVVDLVLFLLRDPEKFKVTADEARAWATAVNRVAATYGKRYDLYAAAELAKLLLAQEKMEALALEQAQRAERLLDKKTSPERQKAVLTALEAALRRLGKTAEAQAVDARLNDAADREYLKKVPPFKAKEFAGRKGTSDRAVVMELFTGAQCPPCVAADVAFDALLKTYQPRDVVLIQYHMHIPGPDPMTNPASEARWDYYRKHFPNQVRGTPTTLLDGKVLPGGGGPMAAAEQKYEAYRAALEPLLETAAGAKVAVRASLAGEKVSIEANVTEVKGGNVKLRLLLVEETIRYVGGNRLRFHHQVVRAFPGGVEGVAIKDKALRHTASIDLGELRKNLNKYLDNYAATKQEFPSTDRPLRFANLRVIALVQDDDTAAILQAAQMELGSAPAGR